MASSFCAHSWTIAPRVITDGEWKTYGAPRIMGFCLRLARRLYLIMIMLRYFCWPVASERPTNGRRIPEAVEACLLWVVRIVFFLTIEDCQRLSLNVYKFHSNILNLCLDRGRLRKLLLTICERNVLENLQWMFSI